MVILTLFVKLTNDCTLRTEQPSPMWLYALWTTPPISGVAQFSRQLSIKKSLPKKAPSSYNQPRTKTYAGATSNQNSPTDHISVTLSYSITNLNSLISPLISLLYSIHNALIAKGTTI